MKTLAQTITLVMTMLLAQAAQSSDELSLYDVFGDCAGLDRALVLQNIDTGGEVEFVLTNIEHYITDLYSNVQLNGKPFGTIVSSHCDYDFWYVEYLPGNEAPHGYVNFIANEVPLFSDGFE